MERYIYQGGYFVNVGIRQWEEWQGNTKAYSFREHNRPPCSAHRVCLSPPAAQAPAPSRQAAGTGYARRPLQARPFPSPAQGARRRGAVGHPSRGQEACDSGVGHQRAPRGTPIPHHLPGGEDCQAPRHLMRGLHRASHIHQLSPCRSRSWPPQHGEGAYPLVTHRHTCDSTPPSGSHSTCTARGYAPTVQMGFVFPSRLRTQNLCEL